MVGLAKMFGPCTPGYDVHHITSKGAGGGDTKENLICLCRKHHNMTHGAQITRNDLRQILAKRYKYNYDG